MGAFRPFTIMSADIPNYDPTAPCPLIELRKNESFSVTFKIPASLVLPTV